MELDPVQGVRCEIGSVQALDNAGWQWEIQPGGGGRAKGEHRDVARVEHHSNDHVKVAVVVMSALEQRRPCSLDQLGVGRATVVLQSLRDISNDDANLDDGARWPTAFALKDMTAAEEARISALVKRAVS
jgi:hypothetical protein